MVPIRHRLTFLATVWKPKPFAVPTEVITISTMPRCSAGTISPKGTGVGAAPSLDMSAAASVLCTRTFLPAKSATVRSGVREMMH